MKSHAACVWEDLLFNSRTQKPHWLFVLKVSCIMQLLFISVDVWCIVHSGDLYSEAYNLRWLRQSKIQSPLLKIPT